MNTQLDRDLHKQLANKLKTWAWDSMALYEMAGLKPHDAISAISTELSYLLVLILQDIPHMTAERFGAFMQKTYAAVTQSEIVIELLHPNVSVDIFGELPDFLNPADPRSAREQFHDNYSHGGGWRPMKGWKLSKDNALCYPGEKPLPPLAQTRLRNELIVIYESAWVAIIQPDRTFEVSRMD